MNETRLCTIGQVEQFLSGCTQIEFTKFDGDHERYEHISRVLKRDKGTLPFYAMHAKEGCDK